MNTRIMAVALVVVSLLGVRATQAEQVKLLRIVPIGVFPGDTDWGGTTRTIIVIGTPEAPSITVPNCGGIPEGSVDGFHVVVIKPQTPAFHVDMYLLSPQELELQPGDRIPSVSNDSIECCLDETGTVVQCVVAVKRIRQLIGTLQQPSSAGSALFSSPVELDSDSIGVVTGQPNDDGTYKVIFKKQGSPAQQVDIATDDVLLAADVLRNLIDLGCDDDTGEHLYLADIEW